MARTALPPAPPSRSDHDSLSLPWPRVAPKSPPLPGRERSGFPLKDNEGDGGGRLSHSFPARPVVWNPQPSHRPSRQGVGTESGVWRGRRNPDPNTGRTRTALFNGAPGPRKPESGPHRPRSLQLKARRGGCGRWRWRP